MSLSSRIFNKLLNEYYSFAEKKQGWKTAKKIVVIESDDWGTIRMAGKEAYDNLLQNNIKANHCQYCKYDAIETSEDLNALCNSLSQFKDINGRHPVITTNTVMANPDFEKIRSSGFTKYYYETFDQTYKRYGQDLSMWTQGINEGFFYPQFHGREHLNTIRWLRLLQNGSKEVHLTFNNHMWGLRDSISNEKNLLMAAFDYDNRSELKMQKDILEDGLNLFESVFGFRSVSFIAPNYTWDSELEPTLTENGVKILQGERFQYQPLANGKFKKIFHYTGQKNNDGQLYLSRNCYFEPSRLRKRDWVNTCLNEIATAFNNNLPAIICAHRVNFMGSLNTYNRDNNLILLQELLENILGRWQDVQFMTSKELGEMIMSDS